MIPQDRLAMSLAFALMLFGVGFWMLVARRDTVGAGLAFLLAGWYAIDAAHAFSRLPRRPQ